MNDGRNTIHTIWDSLQSLRDEVWSEIDRIADALLASVSDSEFQKTCDTNHATISALMSIGKEFENIHSMLEYLVPHLSPKLTNVWLDNLDMSFMNKLNHDDQDRVRLAFRIFKEQIVISNSLSKLSKHSKDRIEGTRDDFFARFLFHAIATFVNNPEKIGADYDKFDIGFALTRKFLDTASKSYGHMAAAREEEQSIIKNMTN